jgi:hypothetical protein
MIDVTDRKAFLSAPIVDGQTKQKKAARLELGQNHRQDLDWVRHVFEGMVGDRHVCHSIWHLVKSRVAGDARRHARLPCGRVYLDAESLRALHRAQEIPGPAAEIQNRVTWPNATLECSRNYLAVHTAAGVLPPEVVLASLTKVTT